MDKFISNITPLPGYVLIQPQDDTQEITTSQGTFKIAESVEDQESQKIGKVVSIGDEYTSDEGVLVKCPDAVKTDSIVVHKQYGGSKIKYKNEELRFVEFRDIVGVING